MRKLILIMIVTLLLATPVFAKNDPKYINNYSVVGYIYIDANHVLNGVTIPQITVDPLTNKKVIILNKDKTSNTNDDNILIEPSLIKQQCVIVVKIRDLKNVNPYNSQYMRFVLDFRVRSGLIGIDFDEAKYGDYGVLYRIRYHNRWYKYHFFYFDINNDYHIIRFEIPSLKSYVDGVLYHKGYENFINDSVFSKLYNEVVNRQINKVILSSWAKSVSMIEFVKIYNGGFVGSIVI